ncbi:FKBP-type peptidyl-prolyl cis-trans isomerase [Parvibium lacunae]|uniref:peptidylprolyl isomerase n=1 Tax=Parvibium lacunae TaxID=1888893 RepID=A0A368L8G9_9BURK|nr:peptidylprolyl isomerase [Parvibium lacunae]RCS59529.1 peptidylprolyl isomerase [Parvibium lacunae]
MKIQKNTVVSLQFKVTDTQGHVLEDGDQPMVYLHGGYDEIFPRIEELLLDKEEGYSAQIQLDPQDAFGDYDTELLRVEDRQLFPTELEVGMQFEGVPSDADEVDSHVYTVTDIAEDKVILDGNHPYAGMALRFELRVLAVREASEQEIEQGFASDASGLTIGTTTEIYPDDDEDEEDENDTSAHNAARQRPRTLH